VRTEGEILFRRVRKNAESDSFVMTARPSISTEQLDCHWTDFYEILFLSIFRKFVEHVLVF
jgi:hypothetical protein